MNSDDGCGHTHLAAAWALGTLTPEEAERFEMHLARCARCQAEVASLQEAADAMADAVAPVAPPPRLSARLMAAVRKEAELFRAAAAHEPDAGNVRRPRRRLLRSTLLVVAAVGLFVAGTVLGALVSDPENAQPGSRTIAGIVALAAGAPDATAAIVVRGDAATLVLLDVKAPADGQIYQAWLERPPAAPVPTGALFSVGATGDTTISLPELRDARRMIVTSEPAGGSRVPTLPAVVVVDLPVAEQTPR